MAYDVLIYDVVDLDDIKGHDLRCRISEQTYDVVGHIVSNVGIIRRRRFDLRRRRFDLRRRRLARIQMLLQHLEPVEMEFTWYIPGIYRV